MEFFRIRRDIPFMRHALVFNIISLLTFLAAVFFSRGLVNLWYGRQKKLKSVLIGQVWKPDDKNSDVPRPDDEERVIVAKRPDAAR